MLDQDIILRRNPDGTHTAFEKENPTRELPGWGMVFQHMNSSNLFIPPSWLAETTIPTGILINPLSAKDLRWFISGPGQHPNWASYIEEGTLPPEIVAVGVPELMTLIKGKKFETLAKLAEQKSTLVVTLAMLDHYFGDGRFVQKYGVNIQEQLEYGWRINTTRSEQKTHPGWDPYQALVNNSVDIKSWTEILSSADAHAGEEPRKAFLHAVEKMFPKGEETKEYDPETPTLTYLIREKIGGIITLFRNRKNSARQTATPLRKVMPKWARIKIMEDVCLSNLLSKKDKAGFQPCHTAIIATCYDGEFHTRLLSETRNGENQQLRDTLQETLHNQNCIFPREEAKKVWESPKVPPQYPAFGGYLFGVKKGIPEEKWFVNQTEPGKEILVRNTARIKAILDLLISNKGIKTIPDLFQQRIFDPKQIPMALKMLEATGTEESLQARDTILQWVV